MIDPMSLLLAVLAGDGVPLRFAGEIVHVARAGSSVLEDGHAADWNGGWHVSHPEHAPYYVHRDGSVDAIEFADYPSGWEAPSAVRLESGRTVEVLIDEENGDGD